MHLDVADRGGVDVGDLERRPDRGPEADDARRRVADLGRAVVPHGGAPHHRVDLVTVGDGVRQPLQDDDRAPVAHHHPGGLGVEGPAAPVSGERRVLGRVVAGGLRDEDADAARHHHVAVAGLQRLAAQVHRHHRGRARGLHADARAGEPEAVGGPRAQEVLVVGEHHRLRRAVAREPAGGSDVGEEVGAPQAAAEDGDPVGGHARSVVQGGGDTLEEDPLLRVDQLRLLRADAEVLGVEQLDSRHLGAHRHVLGVVGDLRCDAGGDELVPLELPEPGLARRERPPHLTDVRGVGETTGHPDDGDGLPWCPGHVRVHLGLRSRQMPATSSGPRSGRRRRGPPGPLGCCARTGQSLRGWGCRTPRPGG